MRRRGGVLVVAVAVCVAAACGIPVDDAPRAAGSPDLDQTTSTTPTPTGNTNTFVYQLLDGQLVASGRDVAARTPRAILESLLDAPSEEDVAQGLVSAIPPETELLDVVQRGDVLDVNLSRDFEDIQGERRQQAFGQIVMTATELPGVVEVTFAVEGTPTRAPSPERGDVSRVRDCDYLGLLAPFQVLDDAGIDVEQTSRVAERRLFMERFCPQVQTTAP